MLRIKKEHNILEDALLITVDAVGLYLSMPLAPGLRALIKVLDWRNNKEFSLTIKSKC